jgi:hypothetical protein
MHEADAFAVVEEEILREIGEDGEITSASLSRLEHCESSILQSTDTDEKVDHSLTRRFVCSLLFLLSMSPSTRIPSQADKQYTSSR